MSAFGDEMDRASDRARDHLLAEEAGLVVRCAEGHRYVVGSKHLERCQPTEVVEAPPREEDSDHLGMVLTACDLLLRTMVAAAKADWRLGLELSPLHTEVLHLSDRASALRLRVVGS